MRAQKHDAYAERNRLVAALSKVFPSHLAQHPDDPTWDEEWRTIVCVHLPTGQATWHIHDSEMPWFSHLEEQPNHWDGHDTPEKYRRLHLLPSAPPDSVAYPPTVQADDSDIPLDVRRELMRCAISNGRINYYYLCDLFRRGRASERPV